MADPADTHRHDVHDDLPLNEMGILTREAAFQRYNIPNPDMPTLLVMCGSRKGNDPAYVAAAQEVSRRSHKLGWRIATGGAPDVELGLMSAVADYNDNLLGISPARFADLFGRNSGLSPRATNIIVFDFYVRKPIMFVVSDVRAFLPGGIGTIEEIFENLIFSIHKGNNFLNTNGFWNPLIAQLHTIADHGLVSQNIFKDISITSDIDVFFNNVQAHYRKQQNAPLPVQPGKSKPIEHLQEVLGRSAVQFAEEIFKFSGDRPRVGVVVTGNISPDAAVSKLKDEKMSIEFCRQAYRLGRDIGRDGGTVVLAGDKKGLRQIVARAAIEEGGQVIWVQKNGAQKNALSIRTDGNEMFITVTREFEKALLFDLVSQAGGYLPGGLHTLDRVFEVVTREQTGFGGAGGAEYMITKEAHEALFSPEGKKKPYRKPVPVMGLNVCGLWTDIAQQVTHCDREGFMSNGDADLFCQLEAKENLGGALVENARATVKDSYDPLEYIVRNAPPKVVEAPAP